MKRLFINIIISVMAIFAICSVAGCSKGSTMNGETMEGRTEQINLNEGKLHENLHFDMEKDARNFGDFLCPECKKKNFENTDFNDGYYPDLNWQNDCEDKDCKDKNCEESDCEDCKNGACKKHKKTELPKPRHPKFMPGKGGRLPKKPHRLPPKSIVF